MKASVQPSLQPRLGCGQIDAGDGDLGQLQLLRPTSQLLHQLLPIEFMLSSHASILESRQLVWPDEAACAAWARQLAQQAAIKNASIELQGDLGAGKTTFVRHLLQALGVQGRIKSPTYTVVESYTLPDADETAVSHFDFYRFNDAREWADAGLRDLYAARGLKLAEWPQKVAGALPEPDLRLLIEVQQDEQRRVTAQACSQRGLALLS